MGIILKERQYLRLQLLVQYGHVYFWANLIPEFFDRQYLWKKSIDNFVWPLPIFFIYLVPFIYQGSI